MQRTICLLLSLLMVLIGTAFTRNARGAAPLSPISWSSAVSEVSRNNADLRAASATRQASIYQVRASYGGYFPQITGSMSASYGTSGFTSLTGQTAPTTHAYNASLNATENLFSGLSTWANIRQAEANEEISAANEKSVRAQVSVDLKTAFAGLLYAQNYVALAGDIAKRRGDNLKMVELRFENGNENKGSLLLSRAYLLQAQYDELQARNAVGAYQRQLAQVLGRDESEDLSVGGTVPAADPGPLTDLKRLAVETPEHLQAVGQENVARAAVSLARTPFFPTLNFVGNVGRSDNVFFPQKESWSIGLNLSYPIFSGGKDYYTVKAAAESLGAATSKLGSTDRELLTKLRTAWNGFTEAVEKLKVDHSFLEASLVREKIGRSKYNNGLLTFEAWDIIENDFISRQKAALQSERDRVTAEAAWEQTRGVGHIP